MSSLAPLSFSCCANILPKMTLEQKEKLYELLLQSVDDEHKYKFSLMYTKFPSVCYICDKHGWTSRGYGFRVCMRCYKIVCNDKKCSKMYHCISCLGEDEDENEDTK